MKNLLLALSLGALASAATAQSCATLTVTGTGAPGTSLTFALSGTPTGSFGILFIGDTQGSTSLAFGQLGTLNLGLAQPFLPVPLMGRPGPGGGTANSLTIQIPSTLPAQSLFAQGTGVTLGFAPTPSLSFCTSDVVPFSVGA